MGGGQLLRLVTARKQDISVSPRRPPRGKQIVPEPCYPSQAGRDWGGSCHGHLSRSLGMSAEKVL